MFFEDKSIRTKLISKQDRLPWFYQIRFHISLRPICTLHALSCNDIVTDACVICWQVHVQFHLRSAALSHTRLRPPIAMLIKDNDFSDLRGSPPHLTTPPSFDFFDNGMRDFPCMPAFKFGHFTSAECEMTPLEESPRRKLQTLLPRENMTPQKSKFLSASWQQEQLFTSFKKKHTKWII